MLHPNHIWSLHPNEQYLLIISTHSLASSSHGWAGHRRGIVESLLRNTYYKESVSTSGRGSGSGGAWEEDYPDP